MKAHQWVEAVVVVAAGEDTVVLTEAMVRMGVEVEAVAEASVDAAAVATIGDSIEAVEVDHEDEEAWGRSSGQVQPGRWMNRCMEMFCQKQEKPVHILVTEQLRRLEPFNVLLETAIQFWYAATSQH